MRQIVKRKLTDRQAPNVPCDLASKMLLRPLPKAIMLRLVPALLALGIALIAPARAWDALGHMIVNQIAYDNLTPVAKEKVDASIENFNRRERTEYTFAVAGCYMDDIRGDTREYNTWHYITLPDNREGLPLPPASEENVLWAIKKMLAILDGKASDSKINRDRALVMLTHLVGDVHQPLHTTSKNDDRGGNQVKVPNLDDPELAIFNSEGNLHWFWDIGYRAGMSEDGTKALALFSAPLYSRDAPVAGHLKASDLVREKATEYETKYPAASLGEPATPEEWVAESHELGFDYSYGKLPGGPNSNPVDLTAEYVDPARVIAEKRVTLAGYRLAAILNERFR